ncbi:MAG: pyridoxal-phosphate dependent enzyme [Gammaproteobacteria bacterium]|nr:pyridoxal-phosphate dependent enzyme [Gammaproteobacteria bacterium]
MIRRYDSVLETIGHTPVVRLARLAPAGVNLYAKLEARNPMGSLKDRLALAVIEDAERRGVLRPGQTVVEATSGNTGIALALVCARKGYPLVVVMAENFSVERRRLMRFLGARVVLTPAAEKGSGMMRKAGELAAAHGWFLCRQFENPANAAAHERTTGPEILEAFADTKLDYFVAGCGTGGTIAGVARVLRRHSPDTVVVACEPDNSPMLGSGLPQPRDPAGDPASSHPMFRPHPMQGWSPDFIAPITEAALGERLVDRIVAVGGHEAMRWSRELACKEGIFTGITGGATLAGALLVAEGAPAGANILCLLPDTGERYQSTPLFADIATEMNEEELAISRSTPGARFDRPVPAAPARVPVAPDAGQVDAQAREFIEQALADPAAPVLMFALEWCEFCWSLRRLCAHYRIPLRSIDLDSVAYQANDLGGRIRAALTARTGIATIPQVFVGGELVGGCTDVIDALRVGHLQPRLRDLGVPFDDASRMDPGSFLPGWLQSR